MTPEARARKWAHSIRPVDLGSTPGIRIIAAAIREAVAEEQQRVTERIHEILSHDPYDASWQLGLLHALEILAEDTESEKETQP